MFPLEDAVSVEFRLEGTDADHTGNKNTDYSASFRFDCLHLAKHTPLSSKSQLPVRIASHEKH